jgi:hypothetical protein
MAGLQQGYKVPSAPDQDFGTVTGQQPPRSRLRGKQVMPVAASGGLVDKSVAVGTAAAVAYLIATSPLALPCPCPGGTERRNERR